VVKLYKAVWVLSRQKPCPKKQFFPRFFRELRTSKTHAERLRQHNKKIPIITGGSDTVTVGNNENSSTELRFSCVENGKNNFKGRIGRLKPHPGNIRAVIE
jgi:hypothetical protein